MFRAVIAAVMLDIVLSVHGATGPCDITGAAGNPCVAAHSTVRALYGHYNGPLYKITRASDGKSIDVGVLQPGGFANIVPHVSNLQVLYRLFSRYAPGRATFYFVHTLVCPLASTCCVASHRV